jgi:hypothetical protein
MAGFAGYTCANEILDFFYRGVAITINSNLYLRLLVATSSRSGGGTETNYTGYTRYALDRTSGLFVAASNGKTSNGSVITFPVATTFGNGDLIAFDVVDTASGAINKVYNGGPIIPAKPIAVGKAPTFRIGALQFSF